MSEQSYHQFCPVAMASELLCTRWTMIVLRELMCGPARFNELRRGMHQIAESAVRDYLARRRQLSLPLDAPPSSDA